ncbi:U3 ribonucleoprotein family protein, partial [Prunus dulcis]
MNSEIASLQSNLKDIDRKNELILRMKGARLAELEVLFKEEQLMRKRYFNTIEDMKGKIRVFCRIRPFTGKEIADKERGATTSVDEFTLAHPHRGQLKQHSFHRIFDGSASQEDVFEDTRHLVQSAVDGYNAYMVELYRETFVDLLLPKNSKSLKLDVKKDPKLSFVDLAGSERNKKSCSSGSELKEAQSINKSLSALGDVIKALSERSQHIPYRNDKLTMLMSDSLGGNAKTLMFINVSPAESNVDETHCSLLFASRVRLIANDPTKNVASKGEDQEPATLPSKPNSSSSSLMSWPSSIIRPGMEKKSVPTPAPLPKADQEKLERKAAYEKSKEELQKWEPILKRNREAPTIYFDDDMDLGFSTVGAIASEFEPRTEFEKKIASLVYDDQEGLIQDLLTKRDFRRLWITRINAVIRDNKVYFSYSKLIHNLYKRQLLLNRKILAQIAILNKSCLYMISNEIIK